MGTGPDIALVSLGTTPGLLRADATFAEIARAAGATCEIVRVRIGPLGALRRQITVTDLVESLAARRAASGIDARAVVYSTVTTALLQPRREPYAIRFDSPAAVNRPGAAGAWQRMRENSALAGATVLLPTGVTTVIPEAARSVPAIPVHVPVPDAAAGERGPELLAYAGYPEKRGLDLLIDAWGQVAASGEVSVLAIGGIDRTRALEWLGSRGVDEPAGVEWLGLLPPDEWRARMARARLFVNASRWEDHGLSQLEALAAGVPLVTVPSAGCYEALPLARELAPELVAARVDAGRLAAAIRAGLALEDPGYAERAAALLEPYRFDSIVAVMRDRVLPALGIR